jgi:hypothetical protein
MPPDQRSWELTRSPIGEFTVVEGPALEVGERVRVVEAAAAADRERVVDALRKVVGRGINFPPGIDLGRGSTLDELAEDAMRTVEDLGLTPWMAQCSGCEGRKRIPCGCNDFCRSSYPCSHCGGRGIVLREALRAAGFKEQGGEDT